MDANSFRIVRHVFENGLTHWLWSADNTNVYRFDEVKKGLQGETFRAIDDFWATDGKSVFCFATQRIYKDIDANTFKALGGGLASDAKFDYAVKKNPNFPGFYDPNSSCFDEPNSAKLEKSRRKL